MTPAKKAENAELLLPPESDAGSDFVFYEGAVRVWAHRWPGKIGSYTLYRGRAKAPAKAHEVLGVFVGWEIAWRSGERAARLEEQREAEAQAARALAKGSRR
jgi:hypothetical protein